MRRYILTGTPGSGKTAVLRMLEHLGYPVVEEAATAVIALRHALGEPEPADWASFVDSIVELQRRRQLAACAPAAPGIQVYDRSPVCTHALSTYLGVPISPALESEVDRVVTGEVYERRVFFVRNLGFVEPTAARRITLADALRFEQVHEETYRAFGYQLVDVPPGPLADRVAAIRPLLV
jgi:predicted ATPase